MLGFVTDGEMPPEQAFRGCLMLSLSIAALLAGGGACLWFLSNAGLI